MTPDEEGVLTALAAEVARAGADLVTVLLGTATYDAERAPAPGGPVSGTVWVLTEDHDGRGLRSEGNVRRVSPDELVEGIMSAQKVISFA